MEQSAAKLGARVLVLEKQYKQETAAASSTMSTPLSAEDSMVIAKERHADRATRLKKALDDEASRRQD